jgi:hypothetical protein
MIDERTQVRKMEKCISMQAEEISSLNLSLRTQDLYLQTMTDKYENEQSKCDTHVSKISTLCTQVDSAMLIGTIWRNSRTVMYYSVTNQPSNQAHNQSSVHKEVKTTEGFRILPLSGVPQSSPLGHSAQSNMALPCYQSQSFASPLGLSAHNSPEDEANPLCALGMERLDKIFKGNKGNKGFNDNAL